MTCLMTCLTTMFVNRAPGFLPDHPKIESLVVCAIPDIPSKFQKDPSITFWVILLTHRQTNKQTDWQTKTSKKHYLLGGGQNAFTITTMTIGITTTPVYWWQSSYEWVAAYGLRSKGPVLPTGWWYVCWLHWWFLPLCRIHFLWLSRTKWIIFSD